jgi:cytochrome P450
MDFLPSFSISKAILTLLVIFILYVINKLIIGPWFLLKFYEKQGITVNYKPLTGYGGSNTPSLQTKKDTLRNAKEQLMNNPNFKGFGGAMGARVGLMLCGPSYLRDISQTPDLVKLTSGIQLTMNPKSMIRMEGEKHKRMRKLISQVFHFEFILANVPVITDLAEKTMKQWEGKVTEDVDVLKECGHYSGEVVGSIFFGVNFSGLTINGKRVTDVVGDLLARVMLLSRRAFQIPFLERMFLSRIGKSHQKLHQDIEEYHAFCKDLIKKRRDAIVEKINAGKSNELAKSPEMLYHLINAQLNGKTPEEKLTDEEIFSQYLLFVGAGEDTTSHLLTMCIYQFTQSPSCVQRLREEIQQNVADVEKMTYEEMKTLTVLDAFIQEALRLYSPAPGILFRIAAQDLTIGDLKIKKDTIVNVMINLESWRKFKDPDTFSLDRWLENGEGKKLNDGFICAPFYAGPRNCIGQHLALTEAKIFLVRFISKFDVKLKEGYELSMVTRFVYEPRDPLKVTITPRKF